MKSSTELNSRRKILEIGEALFSLHGFEGTSIRMMAQQTGLNTSLISYYFGSKTGLYEAIVRERTQDFSLAFRKLGNSKDKNSLDAFFSLYISWFEDHKNFFKLVNREFSSGGKPLLKEIISSAFADHFKQMRGLMDCGGNGSFPFRAEPVFVYLTAYGLLQAYIDNSPIRQLAGNLGLMPELSPERIKEYLFMLSGQNTIKIHKNNFKTI